MIKIIESGQIFASCSDSSHKGWVVQRAHPVDLRYQRFELTDDGFVATQVLLARADAAQQKVMSPLMGRDQHAFMNMLSEMVDTASNEGR